MIRWPSYTGSPTGESLTVRRRSVASVSSRKVVARGSARETATVVRTPKGSREELGALLLGYYSDGDFLYAGKVGTGFTRETLADLAGTLRPLRRDDPPFGNADAIKERGVTWVEPKLVAQIGFTEWTRYGRLRHPRFLGLRVDKAAGKVVREG